MVHTKVANPEIACATHDRRRPSFPGISGSEDFKHRTRCRTGEFVVDIGISCIFGGGLDLPRLSLESAACTSRVFAVAQEHHLFVDGRLPGKSGIATPG